MSILKRILKAIMVLLVILFVAITIFFITFDLNSYKGIITSKASDALGRPLTIESMSMKLSLIPTIEIKGVKIVNNEAFKDEAPLLEIDSVDATLALLPLLKSKVEIKAFNMSVAKVNLFDKNGQNNYTLGGADAGQTAQPAQPAQPVQSVKEKDVFKTVADVLNRLSIDTIAVKTLLITRMQESKKQTLALMDVTIEQLKLVKMTIIYNGKTMKAEVNLGNFASFMARRPNYSFSAIFDAFDARLDLKGTIGDTGNFANMLFNLSLEGQNLKKLVDNFVKSDKVPEKAFSLKLIAKGDLNGQLQIQPITAILGENEATLTAEMTVSNVKEDAQVALVADAQLISVKLAEMYGLKPMSVGIDMAGNMKNMTLNKLTLSGGKSDVVMNGLIALVETVPMIKAQVVSRYFDISDFIFAGLPVAKTQTKTTEQVQKTSLFSDDKIDLSVLKQVNAQVAATLQYIKVPHIDNIGVAVSGDLTNGYLSVPSLTLRMPAGTIKGNVSLNAAQMPAKVQINMQSDELQLDAVKPVAEQVRGADVLTTLKLTTQGDSVKSFVSGLNGQVVLEITKGEILNKWFNSLPVAMGLLENKSSGMNFAVTEQNSELVCGAVNLSVKDGVITSDNQIAIETSVVDFAVSGNVDLPKEELSLTMVPSVSNAKSAVQEALALTKIVKISGPFTQPAFSVDTKTAVQTAVKSGLTALANKVAEKQGIQLSTSQNTGNMHLCERVLGRPLTGQMAVRVAQPVQPKEPVATEPTPAVDAKDMIKQQLLDSLTKALKK